MVKGVENDLYIKLKDRFNKLVPQVNSISDILDTWEKDGIEEAMKTYYGNKSNEIR
jgi:hypothetical protein